jgi:hypothetical protein
LQHDCGHSPFNSQHAQFSSHLPSLQHDAVASLEPQPSQDLTHLPSTQQDLSHLPSGQHAQSLLQTPSLQHVSGHWQFVAQQQVAWSQDPPADVSACAPESQRTPKISKVSPEIRIDLLILKVFISSPGLSRLFSEYKALDVPKHQFSIKAHKQRLPRYS